MNDGIMFVSCDEPKYFVFALEGKEILKISSSGDVFVQGRLAKNDLEVFDMIKKFFDREVNHE